MEQPPAAWQVAPVRKIPLGPQHVERDEEGLLISASVASTVGVELRASILPSGAEAFTGQTAEFTLIHLDVDGETAAVAEELVTPGCETPSSQARFTWEELEVSAVPAFSVVRLVCSTKADDEPGWWVGEQTWLLQGGALVWKGHEVVLASDPEPWSWGECRTTRFEWRNRAGELEVRAQTFPEPDGGYGC